MKSLQHKGWKKKLLWFALTLDDIDSLYNSGVGLAYPFGSDPDPDPEPEDFILNSLYTYASSTCYEISSSSPRAWSCFSTSTAIDLTESFNSLIFGLSLILVILLVQFIAWIFNKFETKNKKQW